MFLIKTIIITVLNVYYQVIHKEIRVKVTSNT